MKPENTALLVIDVQKGLDDPSLGARNNPDADQYSLAVITLAQ